MPHLYRNMLRKIRRSLGRYLSLTGIVLLGSGFYAGIQTTSPGIVRTADDYFRDSQMFDFKIVGSMGLTDSDAEALAAVDGIGAAVPSYSADALDRNKAVRVHALETGVNLLSLISGRLPEAAGECVADSKAYRAGDRIILSGGAEKALKYTEFTVTGTADSVLCLADDYGASSVGDGKLSAFLFIKKEAFDLPAYTEIYVTAPSAGKKTAWSAAYRKAARPVEEKLNALKPVREKARYESIRGEAAREIAQQEQKLDGEQSKGASELSGAKEKLDGSAQRLRLEKGKLEAARTELDGQKTRQAREFEEMQAQIDDGRRQALDALSESGFTEESLPAALSQTGGMKAALQTELESTTPDSPAYAPLKEQLEALSRAEAELGRLAAGLDELDASQDRLREGKETFLQETAAAEAKLRRGFDEIAAGERELEEGYAAYAEQEAEFKREIGGGREKIEQAKADLSKLEEPRWHIFGRGAAVGYDALKSGNNVVAAVAAVFPVFFILLAALMTSNSMSRMIAEERGELGTLSSLGYSGGRMISGYLIYVLSATLAGAAAGFFIGCAVIPRLIYDNFRFTLPSFEVRYEPLTLALILAATAALMTGVTVRACRRELRRKPAVLLRPLPPRGGQFVLLEKWRAVWKRLSFTWKVTVRNLFRYKKRGFMTVVGVAGCTAFLVAGFGLRDSMNGVAEKQYGEIFRYDAMLVLGEEIPSDGEAADSLRRLFTDEGLPDALLVRQSAVTCGKEDGGPGAFLVVPEQESLFSSHFRLRDAGGGGPVLPEDGGAVITKKLADLLKARRGGRITVSGSAFGERSVTVTGIVENYSSNYMYMTPAGYARAFGEAPLWNAAVTTFPGEDENRVGRLLDSGQILNVVTAGDVIQKSADAGRTFNSVVVLIVVVACLLAFIVLYNLTSINISERTREIATLKVLGFTDAEANGYIYREAFLLTLASVAIGLLPGVLLHSFVVDAVEGFESLFIKVIRWYSFGGAILLTVAFSFGMQLITFFKLRAVNMIESLKSVE